MAWAGGRAHQPKPPPGLSPPAVFSLIAKMQFSLPFSLVQGPMLGSMVDQTSLVDPSPEMCAKSSS